MATADQIAQLRKRLDDGGMEPFIRHIRFPSYKNVLPNQRIEFTYPITALVGANGSNKSSILRAIEGCPGMSNVGDYWFSTAVDPIASATIDGDRPSYIYGYNHTSADKPVEVIKTRIQRADDPDYWEPSRAIVKYGMARFPSPKPKDNKASTRWDNINKGTVYIDFREALSAFDKYFHHGDFHESKNRVDRKNFVRTRSKRLKDIIRANASSYSYFGKERIKGISQRLPKEMVQAISRILGRDYKSVYWLRHDLFNVAGYTAIIESGGIDYSEAFAGAGEFAVIRMVYSIMSAADRSLIILDEPEVSLHPGAQTELMAFLREICQARGHQVVIATHSPAIVRDLPPDAIKSFMLDPITGCAYLPTQSVSPHEAFIRIGDYSNGKVEIFVEDKLAKAILELVINNAGESFSKLFDIKYVPGGAQSIWRRYIPLFAAEPRERTFVLLDEDQEPTEPLIDPDDVGAKKSDDVIKRLSEVAKTTPLPLINGGKGDNKDERTAALLQITRWAIKYVRYLPGAGGPEQFIWDNMKGDTNSDALGAGDPKTRFERLARRELARQSHQTVTSDEIYATQVRRLATIDAKCAEFVSLKAILDSAVEAIG